ncbi:MAG TPA: hypothetical protein VGX28_03790 [Frankiaceae bacterium]|nr:hypothetical protein [Frankiaceae bacterium]
MPTPTLALAVAVAVVMTAMGCAAPHGAPLAAPVASPAVRTHAPPPAPARTLPPRRGCSAARVGTLRVCPASGHVGTPLTIEGVGCSPSATVKVSFRNEGWSPGTRGAELLTATADARGYFRLDWTVPAKIGALQGEGGGAVRPGTYYVVSHPPGCDFAPFEVTG